MYDEVGMTASNGRISMVINGAVICGMFLLLKVAS